MQNLFLWWSKRLDQTKYFFGVAKFCFLAKHELSEYSNYFANDFGKIHISIYFLYTIKTKWFALDCPESDWKNTWQEFNLSEIQTHDPAF